MTDMVGPPAGAAGRPLPCDDDAAAPPGTDLACETGLDESTRAAWPEAEAMLTRFRDWLNQTCEESWAATVAAADSDNGVGDIGLAEMVREFTALRHEVKLQTKSARGLDEQVTAAISALEGAGSGLEKAGQEFRSVRLKEAEAARRAAQPLILALADLDEAIARGAAAMRRLSAPAWRAGRRECTATRRCICRIAALETLAVPRLACGDLQN